MAVDCIAVCLPCVSPYRSCVKLKRLPFRCCLSNREYSRRGNCSNFQSRSQKYLLTYGNVTRQLSFTNCSEELDPRLSLRSHQWRRYSATEYSCFIACRRIDNRWATLRHTYDLKFIYQKTLYERNSSLRKYISLYMKCSEIYYANFHQIRSNFFISLFE